MKPPDFISDCTLHAALKKNPFHKIRVFICGWNNKRKILQKGTGCYLTAMQIREDNAVLGVFSEEGN